MYNMHMCSVCPFQRCQRHTVSHIELQEADSAADACGLTDTGPADVVTIVQQSSFTCRAGRTAHSRSRSQTSSACQAAGHSPDQTQGPTQGKPHHPQQPSAHTCSVHPNSVSGHTLLTPPELLLNATPNKNELKLPASIAVVCALLCTMSIATNNEQMSQQRVRVMAEGSHRTG
jgi:hypothetical protein